MHSYTSRDQQDCGRVACRYIKLGDARALSKDEIVSEFEGACIGQDANTRADLLVVLLVVHPELPPKVKKTIRECVIQSTVTDVTLVWSKPQR